MNADATHGRIFALRKQGHTLSEIAQTVGLSATAVRYRLLQNGRLPGRLLRRKRLSQEEVRTILSMREKRATLRHIAAEIGCSHETVRTVLRQSDSSLFTATCTIQGCNRWHYAHGYCHMHWSRSRNGRMDARGALIPLHRFCSRCGRTFFSPPAPPAAQKCNGCRWKPTKSKVRRTQKHTEAEAPTLEATRAQ